MTVVQLPLYCAFEHSLHACAALLQIQHTTQHRAHSSGSSRGGFPGILGAAWCRRKPGWVLEGDDDEEHEQ